MRDTQRVRNSRFGPHGGPTPRLPFDEPDAPAARARELTDARDRAAAVDPRRNVVLEASAGTGKTRVLVDRYINLLDAGVDPRNILAITFTRKAAAEMRERIIATLRRAAEIGRIDESRWRELCARMGEIAISTIDAFCLSLLREFPLEADLDPGFAMADETEVLRFVDDALDATLRACRALASSDPAVELVFAQLGDARLRDGLAILLERRLVARDVLRRFLVRGPSDLTPRQVCRDAADRLREMLRDVEGGPEQFLTDGPRHHPKFALLADDLRALVLDPVAPAPDDDLLLRRSRGLLDRMAEHLLTRNGLPRSKWPAYSADDCDSKEAWKRHRAQAARIAPRMTDEIARFQRDLNVVLSRGVWRIFEIALAQYRRTLAAHGVVDFPDALWRALGLLEQMDEFARSRYLLEARYHHLLVDEFQDTSQAQWDLVRRLVQSWAAGLGLSQDLPLEPSIFIVGDRKQSIYGFRDADAGIILRAAREIAGLRPDGDVRRSIRQSFRASPALLAFTNDVFEAVEKALDRPDAFEYSANDRFPVEGDDGARFGEPALGLLADADADTCAEQLASEVVRLLTHAEVRDRQTGLRRPARAGDIGILFRSRDGHQIIEAALAARRVPSYVYKGLGFFDADEIKDVVALLRYCAAPASDLRASAFARSRFVRLSDPGLQALAPRIAEALRSPVAAEAELSDEDRAVLGQARLALDSWLAAVDRVPPADLLDRILAQSAYLHELAGPDADRARENLKKIRALVRRMQNRGYATMGRVAEHLDRLSAGDESNAAVDAADAVNLMTVHAAKGLEFPIVFLVNVTRGSGGSRPPIRLLPEDARGEPSVAIGDFQSGADDDAADREREEGKRLLYVAMTRARDRLYFSAVLQDGRLRPARGSLAEVMPSSLLAALEAAAAAGASTATWAGASATHRIAVRRAIDGATSREPATPSATGASNLTPLADPDPLPRVTATGTRGDATSFHAEEDADVNRAGPEARLAGTLVHRALEQVARIREDSDAMLARRLRSLVRDADRAGSDLASAAAALGAHVLRRLLARPPVQTLLAEGEWLHEVPFSCRGRDDEGRRAVVRGTIDTLVRLRNGEYVVVEFKTGRRTAAHDAQLAVYVEAARALFPETRVHGLLVYPDQDVWSAASPTASV
jgi:ATP-dependent helicase/nuclease subunit A